MFRVPRVNVIESDEGFSVEVLGRVGLLYTEGAKTVEIDSEVNAGAAGIALYKKSFRTWNPPHDSEVIDDAKRDMIIENIVRAFASQGNKISVL